MHHCLAEFDFNLGNINIHNRKIQGRAVLYCNGLGAFLCYKYKFLTWFYSCDKVENLRPQDCFVS